MNSQGNVCFYTNYLPVENTRDGGEAIPTTGMTGNNMEGVGHPRVCFGWFQRVTGRSSNEKRQQVWVESRWQVGCQLTGSSAPSTKPHPAPVYKSFSKAMSWDSL